MEHNNSKLMDLCKEWVIWIKQRAISTHNEYLRSNQDQYKSGLAFTYYAIYSLIQMQAEAFLIPLAILGLDDLKENDFLSRSIIKNKGKNVINSIYPEYEQSIMGWMKDNIYYIKENAVHSKKAVIESLNIATKLNDISYDKGRLSGYFEAISFMQKQAKKLDISLNNLNIDDIDPDKDLKS